MSASGGFGGDAYSYVDGGGGPGTGSGGDINLDGEHGGPSFKQYDDNSQVSGKGGGTAITPGTPGISGDNYIDGPSANTPGGGGAGGLGAGSNTSGEGGGGGGYAAGYVDLLNKSSINITIGDGGSGGAGSDIYDSGKGGNGADGIIIIRYHNSDRI
jgi:hypothetical protein